MDQGAVTASSVNVVLPIVTLGLGFLSSFALAWFQDRRTSKRERDARSAERSSLRLDRRNEFQRENLLKLQPNFYDPTCFRPLHENQLHFSPPVISGRVYIHAFCPESADLSLAAAGRVLSRARH